MGKLLALRFAAGSKLSKGGGAVAVLSRPVGPTCPLTCPRHPEHGPEKGARCFAFTSRHASGHSTRSRAERERIIQIAPDTVAADMQGLPAGAVVRLMGVGDWVKPGTAREMWGRGFIDWPLVSAVEKGARLRPDVMAWTYTHTRHEAMRDRLEAVGVKVWASCETKKEARQLERGGWRVALAPGLRGKGVDLPKTANVGGRRWPVCPEQRGTVADCATCLLCVRDGARRLVFAEI